MLFLIVHVCTCTHDLRTRPVFCKTLLHDCNSASKTKFTQRDCLDSHAVLTIVYSTSNIHEQHHYT